MGFWWKYWALLQGQDQPFWCTLWITGWWFGTCFILPYNILGIIIPTDFFFRGVDKLNLLPWSYLGSVQHRAMTFFRCGVWRRQRGWTWQPLGRTVISLTIGDWMGHGYGSIPINTIFSGMNIHLPAILMFTRGTRFWHTATFVKVDVW